MKIVTKMKRNLFGVFLPALAGACLFFPKLVLAAATSTDPALVNCENFKAQFYHVFDWVPSRYCTMSGLALFVVQLVVNMAGVAAILWLTLGGFLYMTSSGNEEQAEKGRKIIVNAIIGLVVIIMASAIVRIVSNVLTVGQ
jgi:hypothetical protein